MVTARDSNPRERVSGKIARATGLIFLLAWLPGCALFLVGAGAGGGVGTYAYVKGELKREYHAGYDRTWSASERALKALEIRIVDSQKDRLGGTINARRGDGETVKVALEPVASDRTLVRIRIGTFGDRDASERIEKEIEKRL